MVTGPCVTASRVTGLLAEGEEVARRWGAVAESMEGAAAAHICALYGVPFLEVRGISNLVVDRDRASWEMDRAVAVAARAALAVAAALDRLPLSSTGAPRAEGRPCAHPVARARHPRMPARPDMDHLRLAYSPCPNDTYIFHAWVHGLIPGAPPVEERLEDIDTLNRLALKGEADVIKVSMHAFAHLRERYALLHAGGALGRGCGPLVVARKDSWLRPAPSVQRVAALVDHLGRARVAIPGELTTGALLLGLFAGGVTNTVVMPFDRIMPAVASGEVDAGVIIHEGRFTFGSYGLRRLVDLGEWWEETTGLPIPLGAIAVSRSLERATPGRGGARRPRERRTCVRSSRPRLSNTSANMLKRWILPCVRLTSTCT